MSARKAAAKKASAKKASKKAATKKASKKAVKKAAAKPAAKKAAAKKAVARKTAAKKAAPKKSGAKKVVAKKAAPKQSAAKKATVKKAAKQVAAKKAAPKKPEAASKARKAAASNKAAEPTKGKDAVAAILSRKPAAKKTKAGARKAAKKASRSEVLKKLLAMRAKQTAKTGHKAAVDMRKGAGETRVPTSVAKAAEFAQTRKISSMVAQQQEEKETRKEVARKKRRRRKAPYTKTELRELREILQSERMRLLKDMEVLDARKAEAEAGNRTFSNHQADAATDSSAMETMFVTRRYEEERLGQVVGALERLEKGDYGLCDMCADEPQKLCETCPFIPIGRLRAKPFARLCVPCREQLEKKKR